MHKSCQGFQDPVVVKGLYIQGILFIGIRNDAPAPLFDICPPIGRFLSLDQWSMPAAMATRGALAAMIPLSVICYKGGLDTQEFLNGIVQFPVSKWLGDIIVAAVCKAHLPVLRQGLGGGCQYWDGLCLRIFSYP